MCGACVSRYVSVCACACVSRYVEGPGLYKHGGYWYICASYGNMDWSYTIRCCRQDAKRPPTGPFVDKRGRDCAKFDSATQTFGQSMLLGDDGDQLVPGHPSFWAESDGQVYMGYDYRPFPRGYPIAVQNKMEEDQELTTGDYMGARKVYWHNGWPTIWTPIEVYIIRRPSFDVEYGGITS